VLSLPSKSNIGEKLSDNIEIINGKGSFASFREPAWHSLGEVFTHKVTSASEMLQLANLQNWNVRVEEIPMADNYTTSNPSFWVVRDHPADGHPDVLATVGKRYKTVQNEELFDFGDAILDGANWETAGSIKNGRVVFGSLALERETILDPNGVNDVVKSYLLIHTSHDGSTAVQASVTPVRVVCQNTLNQALKGVKQSYKLRHTQSVEGKVANAREALGLAHTYLDAFELEAQELYRASVNDKVWNDIILSAYPKPEKDAKGSFKKWETKIDELNSIYVGETNQMISGTAWGAYNALTERLDWYRTPRSGNTENAMASASGFDVATNAEKSRLLTVVKSLALV
jgi:phage/plasmid-like protein (TIGR03299 family)